MTKPKPASVMIIDDNEIDLFVIQRTLENLNYSDIITAYRSPIKALQFFEKIDQNKDYERLPEIILLDIIMPGMTGFEFLDKFSNLSKEIKERTKFIIVTSSDYSQDKKKSENYDNVIKYVVKPLSQDDL
jgi:CheY-like chemotaxis protein